jgi:putative FmdB family regulatory protein
MPTYDYKCPKCGTEFQLVQKITAKAGAKCPKCGTKAERQLSGGAGLVFKGSGFYLTDYGRGGQKPRSESSESGSSSESTKADKPAADKPKAEKADKPASKPKPKKDD